MLNAAEARFMRAANQRDKESSGGRGIKLPANKSGKHIESDAVDKRGNIWYTES